MIPGSSSRRPERRARAAPPAPQSSLYEGLKQMTKGRLDDQRGLEINGELPDFLKTPRSRASEPVRREQGREGRVAAPRGRGGEERLSAPVGRTDSWDRDHARNYIDYIDSTFTGDGGTVPSLEAADRLFNTVNPDESLNFSESRLSLGLSRVSLGYNTSSQSYNTSGTSQPPPSTRWRGCAWCSAPPSATTSPCTSPRPAPAPRRARGAPRPPPGTTRAWGAGASPGGRGRRTTSTSASGGPGGGRGACPSPPRWPPSPGSPRWGRTWPPPRSPSTSAPRPPC